MKRVRRRRLTLSTTVGKVVLNVSYGWDSVREQWVCPAREAWSLGPHEKMSPELEDRICFTATQTSSYEKAAEVAAKWGCSVCDSVIYAHVQKRGEEALEAELARVKEVEWPSTREKVSQEAEKNLPAPPFDLIVMVDGWMNRQKGPDWGLKPPETAAERVNWREIKTGIIFRIDHQAQTAGGRGMVIEKSVVSYQGEPWEFCRRFYAEAVRRGLDQARRIYWVADGGKWTWEIKRGRFPWAIGLLDFYHAAQHLWTLAAALLDGSPAKQQQWVQPLLHRLHNGQEQQVLRTLESLLDEFKADLSAEACEIIEREVRYFQSHRDHLAYSKRREEGCPNGSGAMESTCSQLQGRFKCSGQFWSQAGKDHLMALEMAKRNGDWDDLWEEVA